MITFCEGWACGIHALMQVEHLANGNQFSVKNTLWTDDEVVTTDKRYASILNSSRNSVGGAIYSPPSKSERALGFCALLSLNPEVISSREVDDSADDWWLLRCPPLLMENRESLVGLHIAINWKARAFGVLRT